MGDEEGGHAGLTLDAANLLPGLQPQPRVQIGQRLVQQQHPRQLHQRPGDGHALLLAAGKLARAALHQRADLHQRRGLVGPAEHFFFRGTRATLEVLQRKEDILAHGQVRIEGVVLKDHAHAAMLGGQAGHVVIAEENPARGGRFQSADQVQRGGLAAARRPQQPDELAVGDFIAEIVHGHDLAAGTPARRGKRLGQVLQHNFHRRTIPSVSLW